MTMGTTMMPDDVPPATPLDAIRNDIRQICHDMSNPIGILRMAVYVLQSAKGDEEKRTRYFLMMNESMDKMEVHLKRLRALALGDQEPEE
jgi:hypothetical protein